ncbi:MAG: hypothetical protein KY462_08670 [Actinobacteria bacterium]|nr:hypothetical protein [Actinomycetota bacterium]
MTQGNTPLDAATPRHQLTLTSAPTAPTSTSTTTPTTAHTSDRQVPATSDAAAGRPGAPPVGDVAVAVDVAGALAGLDHAVAVDVAGALAGLDDAVGVDVRGRWPASTWP